MPTKYIYIYIFSAHDTLVIVLTVRINNCINVDTVLSRIIFFLYLLPLSSIIVERAAIKRAHLG